ncbi:hypothetical protein HU200_017294 [Digitaria exilis]|uniref:Uncharacterized protein n=1 Tax=Digitaria exilis TaxID=1010633 RepID=A0A835F6P5_9POAL|nr:hypothetical protein HU200_017294 [Digitaria exilis]
MKYRLSSPLSQSVCVEPSMLYSVLFRNLSKVSLTIPLLQYGLPLKIVSYKDLYGWTMDDIVKAIGLKKQLYILWSFSTSDDIAETCLAEHFCVGDIARWANPKMQAFQIHGIYSPNAYRGFAREFIKDLERMRPRAILDIIKSGENFRISTTTRMPEKERASAVGTFLVRHYAKRVSCSMDESGLAEAGIGRTKVGAGSGDGMQTRQTFREE